MQDRLKELLASRVDEESSDQVSLDSMIRDATFLDRGEVRKVLDLGCGNGRAHGFLAKQFPHMEYHGLDIEESAEVASRERTDLDFYSYDGVNIPFEAARFDVIYCRQVLEHVRHPDDVVAEAARVLKPGGLFLASVSQLEPYHSHSIFNWTAFGVISVFEDHGFHVERLAPGIDGITLTLRRLLGRQQFKAFFSRESLFNHYIETQLDMNGRSALERNFLKLSVAGHIVFAARRVEDTPVDAG